MASYNKVILMGNLTRDPQMKYLPSQTAVVEFGLACNRRYKTQSGEQKEEVTFVDCTAFGRTGEVINQYFTKGKPIFIEGRLKYDQWEDKQGGGKRHKLTVVIESFEFVGGRDGAGGGGGGGNFEGDAGGGGEYDQRPQRQAPRPAAARAPAPRQAPAPQQAEPPFSEDQQFKDDDIPF
jgi:single-strand DNA-binding protein